MVVDALATVLVVVTVEAVPFVLLRLLGRGGAVCGGGGGPALGAANFVCA